MIYKMDKAEEFPLIQDVTGSRYLPKILYPIDMKTLIARVDNRYYRRHSAIKYDIKFMEANIRKLIKSVRRDPEFKFDEQLARRLKYHTKFITALCLVFIDTHNCHNPYDLYPHIDDYLETHDVKCYSAKRVHLNTRKKHPNLLPVPHKRVPKQPQSFGHAVKQLKMFKAMTNSRQTRPKTSDTKPTKPKLLKQSSSANVPRVRPTKESALERYWRSSSPVIPPVLSGEVVVAHNISQIEDKKDYEITDSDNDMSDQNYDHSSDVCRSEVSPYSGNQFQS
jgi:hypothetical protein